MATDDDFQSLKQDADLAEPLRRVAYEAGMMLGLEATRDEQAYHRRRLTRHQYWLEGYGTLAGMAVSAQQKLPGPVRLVVTPGLGIDGYGREILLHETYCIDLLQWLLAQPRADLLPAWAGADHLLWLKVTVRQEVCDVALQPVLARKLNLSTDAVQPSRRADSVRLELSPDVPPKILPEPAPDAGADFQPWAAHPPLPDAPDATDAEKATLAAAPAAAKAQLALHARLLHAFDGADSLAPAIPEERQEDQARLLLARLGIHLPGLDLTDPAADLTTLALQKDAVSVNNLVRPFLAGAAHQAWLARQP